MLSSWDGELCAVRYDRETGAWFVIAVHSTRLGPASGGTRAMVYPSVADAVADATRLAAAMTTKMAVAGLPMGGGKSVIALPAPRAALGDARWRRILGSTPRTCRSSGAPTPRARTSGRARRTWTSCARPRRSPSARSVAAGGPGSSAPATALGVFAAVRAAVADAGFGARGVAGLRVLVQGLGAVGARVAQLAATAGADVLVTDIDPARCAAADARGTGVVSARRGDPHPCDVLVPCATGGLIDEEVAARAALRGRRRRGEQPARRTGGSGGAGPPRDRLRAGLRRQRRRRHPPRRTRGAGLDRGGGHAAHTADRRDAGRVFADARARGITTDQAAHDLAARRLAA